MNEWLFLLHLITVKHYTASVNDWMPDKTAAEQESEVRKLETMPLLGKQFTSYLLDHNKNLVSFLECYLSNDVFVVVPETTKYAQIRFFLGFQFSLNQIFMPT